MANSSVENDLRKYFRDFEQHSLRALLWAAAEGRTSRRELSILAASIAEALKVHDVRPRARRVGSTDLEAILHDARDLCRTIGFADDFELPDPNHVVRWSIGDSRFRIDPGLNEDPVGAFAALERLSILDDEAVRAVGFGVADLMELALRSMDRQLGRLAPTWNSDAGDREHGSPSISSSEFEVARRYFPGGILADRQIERVLDSCANPERARRALDFATAPAAELSSDLTATLPFWDGVMAITFNGHRTFVPSSLMLEGLVQAAARLAARLDRRKSYRSRRLDLARAALGLAFGELDNDVIFPVDIGTERPVLVVRPDERHLLVLDVICGATEGRMSKEWQAAATSLRTVNSETVWTSPIGPLLVPSDAEIVLLIIADYPYRVAIDTSTEPIAVSLKDIQYVLGDVEDSLEVWEFLAEVVDPPRIERMVAPGLPELYKLWHVTGSLNPDYAIAQDAGIGWSTFLDYWDESATWESFNTVLAEAGLHSRNHSWRREIVRTHEAYFWSRNPKHLTIVRTEPDLIIEVPLADLGPLDIQIVADFASTLSTASEQLKPFRRALGARGTGLRIFIEANAARPEARQLDRDDAWIGGASSRSPRPTAIIRFDFHLLALFAAFPEEARHLLAMALGQVLSELGVSRRLSTESINAWKNWDGAFRVVTTESAPQRPFTAARTTKIYDTARVQRELSDRLRAQGLITGSFAGSEAIQICDIHVTSALYSMLVDEIATHDRFLLLVRGASEVGAAMGEHRRRSIELRKGLEAPWADDLRMEESVGSEELAKWVRAVQLVLELSLRGEGGGQRAVGRIDWARLLAIADTMFEISQMRSHASFLLEPFEIDIDDGRVAMRLGGPSVYSVAAFDVLRRLLQLRPVVQDGDPSQGNSLEDEAHEETTNVYDRLVQSMTRDGEPDDVPFISLMKHAQVPMELRAVDEAMREHLGTGYDAILATLRTAGSWPRDPGREFAVVKTVDLVHDVHEWSRLPTEEIRAAIDMLTLRAANLRSEAEGGLYPYWHVERRKFRCTTRPFLELDVGAIWVVPELATGAQRVLARYLFDGRVPWPDPPEMLSRRLRKYRETQNRRLEQLAEERLKESGFIARRGLKPWKLRQVGIPMLDSVGEIDVLVADNLRRRLWVIEAKDPEEPFSLHELWSGAEEFWKHYVAQMRRKVIGVAEVCDELVAFLGASPGDDWVVNPLFLTSRIELAAFDSRIDVAPFVTLEDVVEMLQNDSPPMKGFFIPGWADRLFDRSPDSDGVN